MAFSSHQIHSISSSSSTDDEMFLDACEMIQSSASTSKEHNSTDQLFADVDAVNVAIHKKFPNLYVNPNLIFEQLEFWGKEKDRVNIVTKLLSGEESASENQQHADNHVPKCERQENESKVFGNHTASSTSSEEKEQNVSCLTEQKSEDSHDQLMDDVLKVIGVVPTANPEVVYSLLEVRRDEPNRVELIIEEVLREFPVKSPIHLAPLQNDTHVGVPKREPSYSDLNSYNSVKRQRTVEGSPTKDDVKELSPSATTSSNFKTNLASIDEAVPSTSADSNLTVVEDPSVTEARIKERQLVLQGMFPDADPDYLQELVMSYMDNEEELQQAVARMLEEHNYPKMKDRLEKEKLKELKHKYSTWYTTLLLHGMMKLSMLVLVTLPLMTGLLFRTFTVDEVLQWFEDPIKLFYNTSRNLSPSYKEHAYRQLCNDFTKLTLNDIKLALTQNNYCYAPALRFLQQKLPMETKKSNLYSTTFY